MAARTKKPGRRLGPFSVPEILVAGFVLFVLAAGASPRLGSGCPAKQFKAAASTHTKVFSLNRECCPCVGQIKNLDQTSFALSHFATRLR